MCIRDRFCATDAILFYVFFEAMLIPMFLIIGIWGGPRRIYASVKFFLYTFLGSVLMLVGLVSVSYTHLDVYKRQTKTCTPSSRWATTKRMSVS